MDITDDQWSAELHRRMSLVYAQKGQLQKAHTELSEQMMHLKARISAYEQDREKYHHDIVNARQSAINELTARMEGMTGQKEAELDRLQHTYNNVLSENTCQKAEIERLTKEQDRLSNENEILLQQSHAVRSEIMTLRQALEQEDALRKSQAANLSQLQEEKTEIMTQLEMFKAQTDSLMATHKSQQKVSSERVLRLERETTTFITRIDELQTQVQQLKQDLTEQQDMRISESEKVAHLDNAKKDLAIQLKDAIERIQQTSVELDRLRTDKDTVNSLFDSYYEKSNEQEQLLASQRAELEEALSKKASLEEKTVELMSQITSLQTQLKQASKPSVIRVDKAVQVNLQTVDVAVQTITFEVASVPRGVTATTQTEPQVLRSQLQASRSVRNRGSGATVRYQNNPADIELPPVRRQFLDGFPGIDLQPSALTETNMFTRVELSSRLGGGMQGVVGTFDLKKPRKPISAEFDLLGCLYPQRHLNPWLPQKPGEHGYLFLGLKGPGKDHTRFLTPAQRALFIYEGLGWKYYGHYIVERNPERDLTGDEWTALSDNFKDGDDGYCAMTLNKALGGSKYQTLRDGNRANHDKQVREMRVQYDAGELRVPCMSLQCIGYNESFVQALISRSPVASCSSLKRKRNQDDTQGVSDDADPPHPITRARSSE